MGYLPNQPYALWSIWIYLPLLPRLFVLILALVTVYTLTSSAVIVGRLRSLTRRHRVKDLPFSEGSLDALLTRTANLHQLITATFYLFGIVFFFALRFAESTRKNPGAYSRELLPLFSFSQRFFVLCPRKGAAGSALLSRRSVKPPWTLPPFDPPPRKPLQGVYLFLLPTFFLFPPRARAPRRNPLTPPPPDKFCWFRRSMQHHLV